MTPELIGAWIAETFDDVMPKAAWGETSFFVNPDGRLPSGAYFATLKEKNGENDKASRLDRPDTFRLNFGPGRGAFSERFGTPPARPAKGGIIEGPWDFSAKDIITPHPIYGWMSWMAVVNPSSKTFEECKPLLDIAYHRALQSVMKRLEAKA